MANNEKREFWLIFARVGIVILFGLLYCIGGAEFGPGTWLRRYVAPAVIAGGCFAISRDWIYLLTYPLVCIGACLGYGADQTWIKIIKRGYVGLTFGAGVSIPELFRKRYLLAVVELISCIVAFVLFGVWNPFPGARVEEFVLGCVIAFIPAMSARRVTS